MFLDILELTVRKKLNCFENVASDLWNRGQCVHKTTFRKESAKIKEKKKSLHRPQSLPDSEDKTNSSSGYIIVFPTICFVFFFLTLGCLEICVNCVNICVTALIYPLKVLILASSKSLGKLKFSFLF